MQLGRLVNAKRQVSSSYLVCQISRPHCHRIRHFATNHSARNYGKLDGRRTVLNSPSLGCKQFSNVSNLILRLVHPRQSPRPVPNAWLVQEAWLSSSPRLSVISGCDNSCTWTSHYLKLAEMTTSLVMLLMWLIQCYIRVLQIGFPARHVCMTFVDEHKSNINLN